jgi:hypothetical protein
VKRRLVAKMEVARFLQARRVCKRGRRAALGRTRCAIAMGGGGPARCASPMAASAKHNMTPQYTHKP